MFGWIHALCIFKSANIIRNAQFTQNENVSV